LLLSTMIFLRIIYVELHLLASEDVRLLSEAVRLVFEERIRVVVFEERLWCRPPAPTAASGRESPAPSDPIRITMALQGADSRPLVDTPGQAPGGLRWQSVVLDQCQAARIRGGEYFHSVPGTMFPLKKSARTFANDYDPMGLAAPSFASPPWVLGASPSSASSKG